MTWKWCHFLFLFSSELNYGVKRHVGDIIWKLANHNVKSSLKSHVQATNEDRNSCMWRVGKGLVGV